MAGFAGWLLGVVALFCVEGWLTRLIYAYDRRTDRLRLLAGSEDPQGTGGAR